MTFLLLALSVVEGAALLQDPAAELRRLSKEWEANPDAPKLNRVLYVEQIAALKTPEAADYLLKRLRTSRSWEINQAIARTLRTNGSRTAFLGLKEILERTTEDPETRRIALTSAAAWDNEESMDLVVRFARNAHPTNDLRVTAVGLLDRVPLERGADTWLKLLEESEPEILIPALRTLAPLRDPKVVERAAALLANEKMSEPIRAAAVGPLRAMGDVLHAKTLLAAPASYGGKLEEAMIEALGGFVDPEAIALLQKLALNSDRPQTRALCVRALGAGGRTASLSTLRKAIDDPQEWVREAAVEGIASMGTSEAWAALGEVAKMGTSRVHQAAIEMLGRAPADPAVEAALTALAGSKQADVRVAALLAIGQRATPPLLDVVAGLLDHGHWPTRAAAALALRSYRTRRSVDLLIARLAKEDGRLRWDIVSSLRALTGKSLGFTAEPWKEWWSRAADGFLFADGHSDLEGGGPGATRAYYGVPLLSKRIVFCIDSSTSMRNPISDAKSSSRLMEARRELAETLKSLGPDVFFNVIFFANEAEPWKKTLQQATPKNVSAAIHRSQEEQPDGNTNIYAALMAALADPQVDTVFLLSDGDPTRGRFTEPERILKEFGGINRTRRVMVHTIALGPNAFMKALAAQTDSRHVEK